MLLGPCVSLGFQGANNTCILKFLKFPSLFNKLAKKWPYKFINLKESKVKLKPIILGLIIFYLIWFLLKKLNWNFWFGSNRPVSVRFFRTKIGSNRFGSVFSDLARFFSSFFWFGFLYIRLVKPKPNRSVFLKF
jgi:hypothetical protein